MSDTFLCVGGELDGREIKLRGSYWTSGDGTIYKPEWMDCGDGHVFQFLVPEGRGHPFVVAALYEKYRLRRGVETMSKGRQHHIGPAIHVRRVERPRDRIV